MRVHRLVVGGEELVVLSVPFDGKSHGLTRAELAIAKRVMRGETNAEIARARRCSVRTIANHLGNIYRKLRIGSRTELVTRMAGL